MWSLILCVDCQITVTAGSYIQIYISVPLCLRVYRPSSHHTAPLLDLCISDCLYVWQSHSSSPLHGSQTGWCVTMQSCDLFWVCGELRCRLLVWWDKRRPYKFKALCLRGPGTLLSWSSSNGIFLFKCKSTLLKSLTFSSRRFVKLLLNRRVMEKYCLISNNRNTLM